MRLKSIGTLSALLLLSAAAQDVVARTKDPAAAETVAWTVSAAPADGAKAASALTLTLHAQVKDGWHVYGLTQLSGGPTPLLVSLEPNAIAAAGGAPVGSPPVKVHDPSFDLDTQIYSHAFTVALPARVAARPVTGRQVIPVSVRFQTCNDRICQPPKTIHLSAAITIKE
jgi:DsbC/DsbD-like thiol-disulfide interchange protein